jgi:hypothetical protein
MAWSIVGKVASIEKETYRTLLSLCDPQAVVDTLNAHKVISFEAIYNIFKVNPVGASNVFNRNPISTGKRRKNSAVSTTNLK